MTSSETRPEILTGFKLSCHLTTLLMLLQATLAGLFISGEEHDAVDVHEVMSNILVVAVLVQLALAFFARRSSRYALVYWVGLLFVLVVAQTGLGYGSREDTLWEAIHVPVGVIIFGLALVISTLTLVDGPSRQADA